jgi:hypothetical protein
MLQQITSDAENIWLADEPAAEQATMAIDSRYIAYSKETQPKNAEEVRSAINGLFQQLENPCAYNATSSRRPCGDSTECCEDAAPCASSFRA